MPLVLALHGYTSSGNEFANYVDMARIAVARHFMFVAPNGSKNNVGLRYWNATPACCNFYYQETNDAQYLKGIIDKVSAKFPVDKKRIYVLGHSNGGAMAHKMACRYSGTIASIASLAGPTYATQSECKAVTPLSVLQIWGTADDVLNYQGGKLFDVPYPGALATVNLWAQIDKCAGKPKVSQSKIDLFPDVSGAESTVRTYAACAQRSTVTLWSAHGASHVPIITARTMNRVIDFLYAHPKK